MQQIDSDLKELAIIGTLDPIRHFPRSARRIATRILNASMSLGPLDCPARQKAEALSVAIEEYADAIEKLITKNGVEKLITEKKAQ